MFSLAAPTTSIAKNIAAAIIFHYNIILRVHDLLQDYLLLRKSDCMSAGTSMKR
jgi:hypothetical protein